MSDKSVIFLVVTVACLTAIFTQINRSKEAGDEDGGSGSGARVAVGDPGRDSHRDVPNPSSSEGENPKDIEKRNATRNDSGEDPKVDNNHNNSRVNDNNEGKNVLGSSVSRRLTSDFTTDNGTAANRPENRESRRNGKVSDKVGGPPSAGVSEWIPKNKRKRYDFVGTVNGK